MSHILWVITNDSILYESCTQLPLSQTFSNPTPSNICLSISEKINKTGDCFPIQNRAFLFVYFVVHLCENWFQCDFSEIFLESGGWMSVGVDSVLWLASQTQCQLILRYFDSLEVCSHVKKSKSKNWDYLKRMDGRKITRWRRQYRSR